MTGAFAGREEVGRAVVSLALVLAAAVSLGGQAPSRDTDVDEVCLGFAFGTWKPALDWAAAGHQPVDTTRFGKAPSGRDRAVNGTKAEGDTTFILFPMWWPAGVLVSLARMPDSPADSVRGRAVALVADARKQAPATAIRAWLKPCHA